MSVLVDEGLIGFYECIGLIPVYMAKIISNTLNNMSTIFRSYSIDYSLLGFLTVNIRGSSSSERVSCGSLVYKGFGTPVEPLDLSGFMLYEATLTSPRELLVSPVNRVKKKLDKVLKIYRIKEYKASQLLKPGVKCDRGNKCVLSNYGRLSKSTAYLTLSVKCTGKTLQIKTMELADEVINQVFTYTSTLIHELFKRNKIGMDRRSVETLVAKHILDEIRWYTRKYYIDIPESIEKLELYTFTEYL